MYGIDIINHILGKTAIGGHAVGAVFCGTVIQAGRVVAPSAILAAHTAQMGFDSNAVTHPEFIHAFTQGRYDTGVFMTGDKITIRRLPRQRFVHQSHIGAAASAGFDFQQDFHRSGLRCGNLLDLQMIAPH